VCHEISLCTCTWMFRRFFPCSRWPSTPMRCANAKSSPSFPRRLRNERLFTTAPREAVVVHRLRSPCWCGEEHLRQRRIPHHVLRRPCLCSSPMCHFRTRHRCTLATLRRRGNLRWCPCRTRRPVVTTFLSPLRVKAKYPVSSSPLLLVGCLVNSLLSRIACFSLLRGQSDTHTHMHTHTLTHSNRCHPLTRVRCLPHLFLCL
jgi:hypothetical protein